MSFPTLSTTMKNGLVFLILITATCATYYNSINNRFMIDDYYFFQSPQMSDIKFLPYQFVPDIDKTLNIENQKKSTYYRPLAHTVIMLTRLAFGERPSGYHVTNIVFFAMAAFAIFLVVTGIFQNFELALLSALLFCAHPINGVIVNYITAGYFGLQTVCLLLSLWLVWRTETGGRKILCYAGSLTCFLAALLFHETAVILPFYVFALFWIVGKRSFTRAFLASLPHFILLAIFLAFRFRYASLNTSILSKMALFKMNILEYAASVVKISAWYVSKLFYPDGIVLFWSTPVVREHVGLWLAGLFVTLVLLAVLIYIFDNNRVLLFAVSWLLIGLAPVALACLFLPKMGVIIEPHWIVFGSIGFFISVAWVLIRLRQRFRGKVWWTFIFIILLSWITTSNNYNALWGNEKLYCRYWLSQAPGFKSANFYLAEGYMYDKQYNLARIYFPRALLGDQKDALVYLNLGNMDLDENNLSGAERFFRLAIAADPRYAYGHNNLGIVYFSRKEFSKARRSYERAIALNPFLVEPRTNLAKLFVDTGDPARAVQTYVDALRIIPHNAPSLEGLTTFYLSQKDRASALPYAREMLETCRNAESLVDLGSLLAQNGINTLALQAYEKSLRLDPVREKTLMETGKFFGNNGRMDLAIKFWELGRTRYPGNRIFTDLIKQAEIFQQQDRKRLNRETP